MDSTSGPPARHSCLDGSRTAHPVACRTCDPNPALTHVCGAARIRFVACCKALGACAAAFPRYPYCLPRRPRCSRWLALSDCERGDRAGRLALRLCTVFADTRKGGSAHAFGADIAVTWYLAEPGCFGPESG